MDNRRLARIALVALLALGCALILAPFIAAILFAAVICITSWSMYAWFLARLKSRAWLAAMLMTLLLTLVVLLPTALLAASLTEVTPALIGKIRMLIERAQGAPPEWLIQIPLVGEQLDAYWQSLTHNRDEFNRLLRQLYDPTRRFLLQAGALAGEGLLQLMLVLFVAFFIYRDGLALAERLRVFSRKLGGELGEQILALTQSTVNGVMIGIVGTAAAQALVALLGFLVGRASAHAAGRCHLFPVDDSGRAAAGVGRRRNLAVRPGPDRMVGVHGRLGPARDQQRGQLRQADADQPPRKSADPVDSARRFRWRHRVRLCRHLSGAGAAGSGARPDGEVHRDSGRLAWQRKPIVILSGPHNARVMAYRLAGPASGCRAPL